MVQYLTAFLGKLETYLASSACQLKERPHEIGAQNSGFGGGMEVEQVESHLEKGNAKLEMSPHLRFASLRNTGESSHECSKLVCVILTS
jgi:hypothetical protein